MFSARRRLLSVLLVSPAHSHLAYAGPKAVQTEGLTPTPGAIQNAMQRALGLRDQALLSGDQAYGAVVIRGDQFVGEAPSRVIVANDPTAHAEMEAIRDATRRLRTLDLSGCLLVSTSRPCRMCEAAAAKAGIARMIHGESLTDVGAPK